MVTLAHASADVPDSPVPERKTASTACELGKVGLCSGMSPRYGTLSECGWGVTGKLDFLLTKQFRPRQHGLDLGEERILNRFSLFCLILVLF